MAGCSAIWFTIYPGSDAAFEMMEQFQEMAAEARRSALPLFSGPIRRLSKPGETALDVAYARYGGPSRRAYHQGEATDRCAGTARGDQGL